MKKNLLVGVLVILIIALLSSFTYQWDGGNYKRNSGGSINVIDVRTVMVKGHEYIVASQSQGYHQGAGVSIIHSETCPICHGYRNSLSK